MSNFVIKGIDYKKFIQDNFSLLDYKTQQPVPFRFNNVQEIYYEMLLKDYEGMDGVREIILKARREGLSSFVLALFAVDFLLRPYSVSICISHKKDVTERLLKQVKQYIQSFIEKQNEKNGTKLTMKDYLGIETKGMIENKLNQAMFYIGTAGAKVGGRGGFARNLHFCVGKDTKIIMADGDTKKMENIKVGDWVIAEDGSPTQVTNKWDTGQKQMKKIRLWYGNETIDISIDHKMRVMNESGNPTWKKASELTTKDYILWASPKTKDDVREMSILSQKNRQRKQVTRNGNIYIRIKSIEDSGSQQAYDIEVAHESHAYLTVCGVSKNSEAAFYQDTEKVTAEEMITATSQQVPLSTGMIFIESTANGEGNYYHGEWQRAYVDRVSSYTPRFFSWDLFYTEEEVLQRRKEFSNDQMWMQEYPRNPEQAFRTSGHPFFDMQMLSAMEDKKAPVLESGRFAPDGNWI